MQADAGVQVPWFKRLRWRQTSRAEGLVAEQKLLALSKAEIDAVDVPVGPSKAEYIHTLRGGAQNTDSPPLVYIPGYGAGSSFMFRTFSGLTAGFRLFAVDLLGTGLSGRPPFTPRTTQEAEDWFVHSLARWRGAQGGAADKMVLVGHSLGGYLSAVYALRHPEHVKHLILVCPAGVGRRPADWQPPESLRSPWSLRGQLFRTAMRFWNWGFTPGSFVRGMGPWGPRMVDGYTRRRFHQGHPLTDEEALAFSQYMYHVLAARGSGEFALRHLLAPFAFPHAPLEDRLHDLGVPVTFVYGEHDWMDPKAAERVCKGLAAGRQPLVPGDLKVLYTAAAGHYPMIDQPRTFLEQLVEATEGQVPGEAAARVLAAAAALPYSPGPPNDTAAELEEEMASSPVAAEVHVATDM